ncbi:MAG: cryptochrome/photolyase family protein [Deltaproteobacteria bacterium]|nr:cryptochrome/photolyase family protein [Deltaproteobacteria bacterium]
MDSVALIYPHQLFQSHPAESICNRFYVIEEPLFFNQYKFHKHKLILHRATMKMYQNYLEGKGKDVIYVEINDIKNTGDIFKLVGKAQKIFCAELDDNWLDKRLRFAAKSQGLDFETINTPLFLSSLQQSSKSFKKTGKYFMGTFYQEQRKHLNILIENGKPIGGKWSFDSENRKRLPKDVKIPKLPCLESNSYLEEAKCYVDSKFPSNPGNSNNFLYPVTFKDADKWLEIFFEERFQHYGDYQDAISKHESFLFHSIISPALNIGLLTPDLIVKKASVFSNSRNVPLNSVEGFIRQIIGWREYVRTVYFLIGSRERTTNFWDHNRKIPGSFWNASTGIEPVDTVISRVLDTGYCHHIERLMILGNFMLLCEFDPDQVYQWFMELFIDAYDWVMVPNVYGMSQYADGGMIVTKPYISSSNYVRKMSDFKSGSWCEIWDALYWHFIHKHRDFFKTNPRLSMMTIQLDRMDPSKLKNHLNIAKSFLKSL